MLAFCVIPFLPLADLALSNAKNLAAPLLLPPTNPNTPTPFLDRPHFLRLITPALTAIPFLLIFFRTLLSLSKSYLSCFESNPNSLRKTPGVWVPRGLLCPPPAIVLHCFAFFCHADTHKPSRFNEFHTLSPKTPGHVPSDAPALGQLFCLQTSTLPPLPTHCSFGRSGLLASPARATMSGTFSLRSVHAE